MNWDDLRFVLAVADAGSVSGAARALGVNHATVLRRVAAWEEAHGSEVFERSAQGYRLRTDRAALIAAARSAAQAMETVAQLMAGRATGTREVLRITSVDSLCQAVLAPAMGQIAEKLPDAQVVLLSSNAHLDMARLQADICVRASDTLPDDMAGDAVCHVAFAAYATPDAPDQWLGMTGPVGRSQPAEWMADQVPAQAVRARADSFVTLRDMAKAGAGVAVLPVMLGDTCPQLQRRPGVMPAMTVPLWVACHRDLANAPRLTQLRQVVTAVLQEARSTIEGRVTA